MRSRTLTASDRSALIRLASTMPVGSEERRTLLAGLSRVARGNIPGRHIRENAQVSDNAHVYSYAVVYGNAKVSGAAKVSGNAQVYGDAKVLNNAQVYGDAKVYENAVVYGDAKVYEKAQVYGNARVHGNAVVIDTAQVSDATVVADNAKVYGKVSGNAVVYGNAKVYANAQVFGKDKVSGNAQVAGKAKVYGDAKVAGDAWLRDNARIGGDAVILGGVWDGSEGEITSGTWSSHPAKAPAVVKAKPPTTKFWWSYSTEERWKALNAALKAGGYSDHKPSKRGPPDFMFVTPHSDTIIAYTIYNDAVSVSSQTPESGWDVRRRRRINRNFSFRRKPTSEYFSGEGGSYSFKYPDAGDLSLQAWAKEVVSIVDDTIDNMWD